MTITQTPTYIWRWVALQLRLVLSLSWCFFMGVTAQLPWVGVGMELAALIAGVALATFPYSAEFNGKIKYIRDSCQRPV